MYYYVLYECILTGYKEMYYYVLYECILTGSSMRNCLCLRSAIRSDSTHTSVRELDKCFRTSVQGYSVGPFSAEPDSSERKFHIR